MNEGRARLSAELAAHNAALLRILARAPAIAAGTQARNECLRIVAQIEEALEDALAMTLAAPAGTDHSVRRFDADAAVDTTRDLIVRAKVAITSTRRMNPASLAGTSVP